MSDEKEMYTSQTANLVSHTAHRLPQSEHLLSQTAHRLSRTIVLLGNQFEAVFFLILSRHADRGAQVSFK